MSWHSPVIHCCKSHTEDWTDSAPHLVVVDDAFSHSLVQHLLVPLLQAFWLWDLLVRWVTMEDVVVPLTGRTGPDVTCCKPEKRRRVVKFTETNIENISLSFLRLMNAPCSRLMFMLVCF